MDFRLVCSPPCGRSRQIMLRPIKQSAHRLGRQELRSRATAVSDSAQGGQGRLVPVRAQLLPSLSARGAPAANDRHLHESHRLSMHHSDSTNVTGRVLRKSQENLMKHFFDATFRPFTQTTDAGNLESDSYSRRIFRSASEISRYFQTWLRPDSCITDALSVP